LEVVQQVEVEMLDKEQKQQVEVQEGLVVYVQQKQQVDEVDVQKQEQ
jgi:hypothetical protein